MIHSHVSDPAQLDLRPRVAMRQPERVYGRYTDATDAHLRHENEGHDFSVATCGTPPEWATEILLGDGTAQPLHARKEFTTPKRQPQRTTESAPNTT